MTIYTIFIDALRYVNIYLIASWKKKQSSTTEKSIIGISTLAGVLIEPISGGILPPALLFTYIGRFGKIITEKSQKASKFITKTTTLQTMTSRILSYCRLESIEYCIRQKSPMKNETGEDGKQLRLTHMQKLGTLQRKVLSGIKQMALRSGKIEILSRGFASNAARRSQQKLITKNTVQMLANPMQGVSLALITSLQFASSVVRILVQTNTECQNSARSPATRNRERAKFQNKNFFSKEAA